MLDNNKMIILENLYLKGGIDKCIEFVMSEPDIPKEIRDIFEVDDIFFNLCKFGVSVDMIKNLIGIIANPNYRQDLNENMIKLSKVLLGLSQKICDLSEEFSDETK